MPAGEQNRVFVVTFAQGVPRNSRGRAHLQSFSIYSWRGSAGVESRNVARENRLRMRKSWNAGRLEVWNLYFDSLQPWLVSGQRP